MLFTSYIITEIASVKIFSMKKKNSVPKSESELITEEKERLDRIEHYIMLLPLIVTLLCIIVMSILYKIFMN